MRSRTSCLLVLCGQVCVAGGVCSSVTCAFTIILVLLSQRSFKFSCCQIYCFFFFLIDAYAVKVLPLRASL